MKGINLQIGNVLQAWSIILADLYLEKGETEKSNAVLEKMVQIPPVWMAYQFRSGYYNRKGKIQKAEEDHIKSIEAKIESVTKEIEDKNIINPRKAAALITRGDYFVELKQFDKAIADYEMAKTLDNALTAKAELKIEYAKLKEVEEKSQSK
jgi:tetratricopeptide (TPR) repeat protein